MINSRLLTLFAALVASAPADCYTLVYRSANVVRWKCLPHSDGHLVLDRWGFALEIGAEPAGRCVDTWRTCRHDAAFTAVMYADALRAGIAGRAEPHSLFSDLLPPQQPGSRAGDTRASCLTLC